MAAHTMPNFHVATRTGCARVSAAYMTLVPVKVCELPYLPIKLCSNVLVSRYASSNRLNSRSVNPMNFDAHDARVPN